MKSTCPVSGHTAVLDYDPTTPEAARDPYPGWARARAEAPIFYTPDHGIWWVTRYADIATILKDPETFSNQGALETPSPPADLAHHFEQGAPWEHTILVHDPPDHTRLRKLAQYAFTPRYVARREDEIRTIANGLVDAVIADREADLVHSYSEPLPLIVISRILGVPDEDRARLRSWTETFFTIVGAGWGMSEEQQRPLWEHMLSFMEYGNALIEDRRANPGDDLITELIAARTEDDEPSLTTIELLAIIQSLLTAGNETSASLIAKAIYYLLRNRDQWDAVREDASLIPAAAEETMRYCGPVNGVRRRVTKDTTLGGVELPKGARLFLALSSSGRDPDTWPDPERFDITRKDLSQQLGLGRGTHFCLGAPLARLEAKVALEVITQRMPDLRISAGEEIEYYELIRVHSPKRLRVEWG
jgi:cytochrome P450